MRVRASTTSRRIWVREGFTTEASHDWIDVTGDVVWNYSPAKDNSEGPMPIATIAANTA